MINYTETFINKEGDTRAIKGAAREIQEELLAEMERNIGYNYVYGGVHASQRNRCIIVLDNAL